MLIDPCLTSAVLPDVRAACTTWCKCCAVMPKMLLFLCVWHLPELILTLDLPVVNGFPQDAQLER